jgi:hypothetical protein|tara:strand:- start:974 stop:1507 length:534 start_codon:yes stop_codon:yes gene_type:complete
VLKVKMKRNITGLKSRIYHGYENLLLGRKQEEIQFPEFLRYNNWVYCKDEIEDDVENEMKKIKGITYLVAKEISTKNIGEDSLGIITYTGKEGIESFENYSARGFKPIFPIPEGKGLIANLTALESNPDKLEGYTPNEIIKINFKEFPNLKQKFRELSKNDYLNYYGGKFGNLPLFF